MVRIARSIWKGTCSLLGKCKTTLIEIFFMPGIIFYKMDNVFDNVSISYSILYVMKIISDTLCRLNIPYRLNLK